MTLSQKVPQYVIRAKAALPFDWLRVTLTVMVSLSNHQGDNVGVMVS